MRYLIREFIHDGCGHQTDAIWQSVEGWEPVDAEARVSISQVLTAMDAGHEVYLQFGPGITRVFLSDFVTFKRVRRWY